MADLGLTPPLRIERLEECFKVIDAAGIAAAYVYTCEDRERRLQTRRIAQAIARAITVEIEGGE